MKNENDSIFGGIWFLSILLGTVVGLWTDFKTGFTAFVLLLILFLVFLNKYL